VYTALYCRVRHSLVCAWMCWCDVHALRMGTGCVNGSNHGAWCCIEAAPVLPVLVAARPCCIHPQAYKCLHTCFQPFCLIWDGQGDLAQASDCHNALCDTRVTELKAKGPPPTPRSLVTSCPAAKSNAAVVKAGLSRYLNTSLPAASTNTVVRPIWGLKRVPIYSICGQVMYIVQAALFKGSAAD
jgi:hypothetical protein